MRFFGWISGLLLALAFPLHSAEIRFDFGDAQVGSLPTNFVAELSGVGEPGVWKIVRDQVPSGFAPFAGQEQEFTSRGVLAQTSTDPADERFPMLLFTGEKFRNFRFTTRFKLVSGAVEQMAGVVFRYQNPTNYYVVRASGLGNNVRFYKVVNGQRSDPIGPAIPVAAGTWHTLAVQCEGTQISFWFDDRLVMPPLGDNSLNEGLLGFRTKSDAVVYYSDSVVHYTPVVSGAQVAVNKTLEIQSRLLGLRIYQLQTNGTTRVIASKDPAEIGMEGTEAELNAIKHGTTSYGKDKEAKLVTLPLNDRNGEHIAAVRVRLETFFGETQDNAVNRARMVVKVIQNRIGSEADLE